MTDEEIVKLYLKRDPSAIRCSQLRYGERLLRIAQEITADPSAAEEIENDTYFRAWESIPPKEPYTYLFAFLARIARNLALSLCREQSRLKRAAFVMELSEEMAQCLPARGGGRRGAPYRKYQPLSFLTDRGEAQSFYAPLLVSRFGGKYRKAISAQRK